MPTITLVIEKRVANMLHVNTNLVRTPGFKPAFHQCDIRHPFQHFVVCYGMFCDWIFTFGKYSKQHSIAWIASQCTDNCAFIFFYIAPNKCLIATLSGFIKELFTEICLCHFGFGNKQQTRSILVDTMY